MKILNVLVSRRRVDVDAEGDPTFCASAVSDWDQSCTLDRQVQR